MCPLWGSTGTSGTNLQSCLSLSQRHFKWYGFVFLLTLAVGELAIKDEELSFQKYRVHCVWNALWIKTLPLFFFFSTLYSVFPYFVINLCGMIFWKPPRYWKERTILFKMTVRFSAWMSLALQIFLPNLITYCLPSAIWYIPGSYKECDTNANVSLTQT